MEVAPTNGDHQISNKKNTLLKKAFWFIVYLLSLWLLCFFSDLRLERAKELFLRIDYRYGAPLLITGLGMIYLLTLRWRTLLCAVGFTENITFNRLFHYQNIYMLIAQNFMPLVGEMSVKTTLLKVKHHIPLSDSIGVLIIERALNILVLGMALSVFAISLSETISIEQSALLLVTISVGAIFLSYCFHKKFISITLKCFYGIKQFLNHIPVLKKVIHVNDDLKNITEPELNKQQLLKLIIASLLIYLSLPIRYHLMAYTLNIEFSFLSLLILYPSFYIVGSIHFTPGGLLTFEFGWWGLLQWMGVSPENATLYVASMRSLNFIIFGFCMVLSLFLKSFEKKTLNEVKFVSR